MSRSFAFAILIALTSQVSAEDKKADEADLKALVGKWSVEKAELGGKDVTEHLKVLKFEITDGGKYVAQLGDEKDVGSFTVDASRTPKEMDVKPTGGPTKGKTVKAIYKIDGDTVTICYELSGTGDRPKKFETKADTKLYLSVYKPEKK